MPRKTEGRGGRGALSPEERDLWRQVTREATPLPRRKRGPSEPQAIEEAPKPPPPAPAKAKPKPPRQPGPPKAAEPALAPGSFAGLDRRTGERLRRGQLPIEASLDLHGYTQAAAHRELDAFLARAQAAGKRCVIVITGRGATKEAGGILRKEVPRWLNQAPNRARILGFATAQPQHGGAGALYVLLRRNRET